VTDYGYRAADLMQGGVGDCWFMSALAVVAHRHDLICKLLEVPQSCTVDVSSSLGTAMQQISNAAGVYTVRLFLDGSWNTVFVDDQLPVSGSPRRFDIALNFSSLAFCKSFIKTQLITVNCCVNMSV
jgi:calpain-15